MMNVTQLCLQLTAHFNTILNILHNLLKEYSIFQLSTNENKHKNISIYIHIRFRTGFPSSLFQKFRINLVVSQIF